MATVDRPQFSLQQYVRSRPGWSRRMKLNVIMAYSLSLSLLLLLLLQSCDVAKQFCWNGTAYIALTDVRCLKVGNNELAFRSVGKVRDVLYFRALSKHCAAQLV